MTIKKQIVSLPKTRRRSRPFLQPLAVALVSIVLVSFVLIMGLMDLRTLDSTLVGYMESRGLEIIGNIQQAAKYNYQRLGWSPDFGLGAGEGPLFSKGVISLEEALTLDLLKLAQEMDVGLENGSLSDKELKSLASHEDVWLVAVFDEEGVITYKNTPVPQSIITLASPVIKKKDGVKIDIFGGSSAKAPICVIALRRKGGRGTIVLALNNDGFFYWRSRISLEKAVEDVGALDEIQYLRVKDTRDRFLIDIIPSKNDNKKGETRFDSGGRHPLEIVGPIELGGTAIGNMRLGIRRDRVDMTIRKERSQIFISTFFMILIALLCMWFLYRNQNRHLARLGELEKRLNQAERLSAMGRLAAGVAHEIRNPLNAISMACQRLRPENLEKLSLLIAAEIRRLNHIVEEFLGFSRSGTLKFARHDLIDFLQQTILLVGEEADSKGITIKTSWEESHFMVSIDSDKMKQAILNVTKNAVESMFKGGLISLSVRHKKEGFVSILISDTGTGLTPEEIEQIFDPDYTTKEKGLGLGLPIAHEIIMGHGGDILVRSMPGKGTVFEIVLPINNKSQ